MHRYIWPALLLAAAGYVHHHNSSAHGAGVYGFPFVEALFPETAGNPAAVGEKSVMLIVMVAVVLLAVEIVSHIRGTRRRKTRVQGDYG